LITRLLHFGVSCFQALRRSVWFFTRPQTTGVHGIPLTPEGRIVLVTLSYATGWRLPGGGVRRSEDDREAMLRELGEEIGLTTYESVELVGGFKHRPDFRQANETLYVVRGVRYQPRWSLEVKDIGEFDLDRLPDDTASVTRQLLVLAGVQLS
jgi:8-oxo-dGTP pyrophosphatase MutT (NUDIX family)